MNTYIAVATKARAMYGECLTNEDFANLMNKKTVAEIFAYLKANSSYKRFFKDLSETDVHRGEIEKLLWKEISDEYKRIQNFVDASKSQVLQFWFARHEVDFLKHSIRNIYNHENAMYRFGGNDEFDEFFKKHTMIDVEMCKNATCLSDFAKACERTVYAEALNRAESVNADYFSIAMSLDGLFYKLLWGSADKYLSGNEKKLFEDFVGTDVDMLNIMWIYRSKKYFKFDNKIIYTYLLPVKYKLNDALLTSMVEAQDPENIPKLLENTKYKDLFDGVEDGYFIEENYRRKRYKINKKIFRTNPETIAGLFAYLGLKELEILNITRIIEGIRYDINPELIKKHLGIV